MISLANSCLLVFRNHFVFYNKKSTVILEFSKPEIKSTISVFESHRQLCPGESKRETVRCAPWRINFFFLHNFHPNQFYGFSILFFRSIAYIQNIVHIKYNQLEMF